MDGLCVYFVAIAAPLIAVDAPSLLYRAFFALPGSITDAEGRPVNALLGCSNLVLQAVERYAPRAGGLGFGGGAAAHRPRGGARGGSPPAPPRRSPPSSPGSGSSPRRSSQRSVGQRWMPE